jgi:hypothetical protein
MRRVGTLLTLFAVAALAGVPAGPGPRLSPPGRPV